MADKQDEAKLDFDPSRPKDKPKSGPTNHHHGLDSDFFKSTAKSKVVTHEEPPPKVDEDDDVMRRLKAKDPRDVKAPMGKVDKWRPAARKPPSLANLFGLKKDPKAGKDFTRKPAADDPGEDSRKSLSKGASDWADEREPKAGKDFKRKPAADDEPKKSLSAKASDWADKKAPKAEPKQAEPEPEKQDDEPMAPRGSLRDPQGFIKNVHGFMNRFDDEADKLRSLADKLANDKGMAPTPRLDMGRISKDVVDLKGAAEPALTKLGKDLKNAGTRLDRRDAGGGADVRGDKEKAQDKKAFSQRIGLRKPPGV